MEQAPIPRRTWLRAALALGAAGLLPGCADREVAISAFSKGLPRQPATTAYFDDVYAALVSWLKDQGYAVAEAPDPPMSWSSNYASQTDHWFYSENERLRVMARRPTSEVEGLDVYVCLSVKGRDRDVKAAQQRGELRIRALGSWWRDYLAKHPLPNV